MAQKCFKMNRYSSLSRNKQTTNQSSRFSFTMHHMQRVNGQTICLNENRIYLLNNNSSRSSRSSKNNNSFTGVSLTEQLMLQCFQREAHKTGDKIRRQVFPFTKLFFITKNIKIGDFDFIPSLHRESRNEFGQQIRQIQSAKNHTNRIENQTKYRYNVHWIWSMSERAITINSINKIVYFVFCIVHELNMHMLWCMNPNTLLN